MAPALASIALRPMNVRLRQEGRRGATLAEVMLALGLAVVVTLISLALVLSALKTTNKSSDLTSAEALAQDALENFIYGLPDSGPFWTTTSFASPYQQDTVTLGQQQFRRTLEIFDHGAHSQGLRQIVVRVDWEGGQSGRAGEGRQVREVSRLVSPP